MFEFPTAQAVDAHPAERPVRLSRSRGVRSASATLAALALLVLALMSSAPSAVLPREDSRSKSDAKAGDQSTSSGFAAEVRRTLKEQHDRMVILADQLIEITDVGKKSDLANDHEVQLAIQPTKIESAKARVQSAELARQAAEIAVTEFENGSFVREQARADAEVKLARRELERLQSRIPRSTERRLMIEQAEKGARINVAPLIVAELQEKKAGYVLEQAESKRKVLLEYTNGFRSRELRAQVEKARSEELHAKATRELEAFRLNKLQQTQKEGELAAGRARSRDPHDRQALTALDRAIPVEEQLRAKLERADKSSTTDSQRQQEIQNLSNQLRALVDQADIERSAARFDALKATAPSTGRRVAGRTAGAAGIESPATAKVQNPVTAPAPSTPADLRWTLKTQQDRILNLASQLEAHFDPAASLADQLVNLQITARSHKANFENAKLTREVAEIAIVEYEQGIFIQDKQTLTAERLLALNDRDRQRDRVQLAREMVAGAEKAKDPQLNDILEAEQIELGRRAILLADSDCKLKVLEEYSKPKRLKELRSEVERARADELAKRAESELSQSRVKQVQEAIKTQRRFADQRRAREELDRRTRDSLNRAISIAEQLQAKLDQLAPSVKPEDLAQRQARDLSNQLQLLLDEAEAEQSAAQFDGLKAGIHSAAN
jgi:hypothetical protein